MPRGWLVQSSIELPPLHQPSQSELDKRTAEVFLDDGAWRDLRATAVLEGPGVTLRGAPAIDPAAECELEQAGSQELVFTTQCRSESLLVVNDLYTTSWRAWLEIDPGQLQEVPIHRVNRVMRGVVLPAGKHRVVMRYRPKSFYVGALLSAVAWLCAAVALRRAFSF